MRTLPPVTMQRLSNEDLHSINSVREENRALFTNLRLEIQEMMPEHATLHDIQRHQHLLDRNDLFHLLGDRFVLTPDVISEGTEILAQWREHPSLIDEMDLQQTIDLLADLLYLHDYHTPTAIRA